MKLTWLGHSCFKMESNGYTIILDPYEDGYVPGLAPVRETADAVFCSHEHSDHNGRETVTLKQDGVLSPFTITEIHTWHDDARGTKRGSNCIRIFDDGTYRVAHLGDLGCELEPEQIEALKGLDAVMIPVGGSIPLTQSRPKPLSTRLNRGLPSRCTIVGKLSAMMSSEPWMSLRISATASWSMRETPSN